MNHDYDNYPLYVDILELYNLMENSNTNKYVLSRYKELCRKYFNMNIDMGNLNE